MHGWRDDDPKDPVKEYISLKSAHHTITTLCVLLLACTPSCCSLPMSYSTDLKHLCRLSNDSEYPVAYPISNTSLIICEGISRMNLPINLVVSVPACMLTSRISVFQSFRFRSKVKHICYRSYITFCTI